MPGLQDRHWDDSSSDNGNEHNWGDDDSSRNTSRNNKEYLLNENDVREERHPYDLTNTNSILTTEWLDNDTNYDEYDGESDKKGDEMSIIITKHPIIPLQLQEGDGTLQDETVIEDNFKEVVDNDETVRIVGEQEKEEVKKYQLDNNKNGIVNDESSDKSKSDVPTITNKKLKPN